MLEIFDSHFHVWDLEALELPWLDGAPEVLRQNFSVADYVAAYEQYAQGAAQAADKDAAPQPVAFSGGVYVEVDCADPLAEDAVVAEYEKAYPAVFRAKAMRASLCGHMRLPAHIAGVREPLHIPASAPGRCLEQGFLDGLALLAEQNLVFESCNRVEELRDLYEAARQVPQATIVLNHCGNVATLDERYREDMALLASLPNVHVKLSGYPTKDPTFVKELLDLVTGLFGKKRLLYASNYPVIKAYGDLAEHIDLLRAYFGDDPDIFAKNAKKLYRVNKSQVMASVICLKPEKAAYYKQLHANPFPAVNDMIRECGIVNYTIYNRDNLLFSLMEYVGDDFAYDMAKMDHDPETNRWWNETDPCQYRIPSATKPEWWADMELVYDLHGLPGKDEAEE